MKCGGWLQERAHEEEAWARKTQALEDERKKWRDELRKEKKELDKVGPFHAMVKSMCYVEC